MPQRSHDLPPHLRPVERPPQPEVQELPLPDDQPPAPHAPAGPEVQTPSRSIDPFLRQA